MQYDFSSFSETEPANSMLLSLYNIWESLCGDAVMPRAEAFASGKLSILRMKNDISLLDVSSPNPWNFKIVTQTYLFRGDAKEINHDGFIRDIPELMHSRATMRECIKARQAVAPLYHELFMNFSGASQHFMQVSLPLSNADGLVSHLLFGTRDIVS